MRFVGIDIASEKHVVAIVDEAGEVLCRPTTFTEDAVGYDALFGLLGASDGVLVTMEATGHYWKNLFAALAAREFVVALVNPARTHRFSAEDLQRTKTDAIDALAIARFAAQKRPTPTKIPEAAAEDLRELVRLRDRLVQDFGDRIRQLHRLVDLGFPEFTRHVKSLDSALATGILHEFPTAAAFDGISVRRLAAIKYDGVHKVGSELATEILAAAKVSVGAHHGEPFQMQVRFFCEDLDVLRKRIRQLDGDIETKLEEHEVGKLLTTIGGIGPQTAARIIAKFGDPSVFFRNAAAFSSFVGVIPGLRLSGKKQSLHARMTTIGDADLRTALYMPTLSAIRGNPWLRSYYKRLRANGKPAKVAIVACMHKLLLAIYSVAKNRRPFIPIIVETT